MEFGFTDVLVLAGAGTAFAADDCVDCVGVCAAVDLAALLDEGVEVVGASGLGVVEFGATAVDAVLVDVDVELGAVEAEDGAACEGVDVGLSETALCEALEPPLPPHAASDPAMTAADATTLQMRKVFIKIPSVR